MATKATPKPTPKPVVSDTEVPPPTPVVIPFAPERVEIHSGPSHFFIEYEGNTESWRVTQVTNTESGLLHPVEYGTRGQAFAAVADVLSKEPNAWPSDVTTDAPRYTSPDPHPVYPIVKKETE